MRQTNLADRVVKRYEGQEKQEPLDTVSGRVPRSAVRQLDHIASKYGVTRGRLVADLVLTFLEDWEESEGRKMET